MDFSDMENGKLDKEFCQSYLANKSVENGNEKYRINL